MSQFDEDGFSLAMEEFIDGLERVQQARLQKIKELGYKEYDSFGNKARRMLKKIKGEKYLSHEEWNRIVDKAIEEE